MKTVFVIVSQLVLPVFAAHGANVAQLPDSEFADTEVVTNLVLSQPCDDISGLQFTIDLQASPSNNVEVAVGHDADGDGHLSLDESDLAVGYDCGRWFVRSSADDSATATDAADSGVFRRTYRIRARRVNPLWNLVKLTRRGIGASAESVSVEFVEHGFMVRLL